MSLNNLETAGFWRHCFTINSSRRCTIKDIAVAAGISHTAVSLALRNHTKVSEATRERVQKLADEMGYRPDPTLGSLVAYRQGLRPTQYRETIAWFTCFPTRDGWKGNIYNKYFEGAAQRGLELGFTIDHFWLKDEALSSDQIGRILRARGIRGALICPLPDRMHRLNLPWERLTAVTFGHGIMHPRLHRVACDHFAALVLAFRTLRHRGFRRIGLVLPFSHDVRVRHSYSAAYFSAQQRLEPKDRIPIFYDRGIEDPKQLGQWVREHKPEAVMTVGYGWLPKWFEDHRAKLPRDFASVLVCSHDLRPHYSGIDEDSRETGATAMDLLFGQLLRNESGIPQRGRLILTPPRWNDGESEVRKVTSHITQKSKRGKSGSAVAALDSV